MKALVTQSFITTRATPAVAAPFTDLIWYGIVGGPALPVDPDPNSTPPAPGRILRNWPKPALMGLSQGSLAALIVPIAGGSMSVLPWFYDDTQAFWIRLGIAQNFTPTAPGVGSNLPFFNAAGLFGAKMFLQITANVNCQAIAMGLT